MRTPFFIAAFALSTFACKAHEQPYHAAAGEHPTDWAQQGEPGAQTVPEVMDQPQFGENVTVKGEVDNVLGPRVFTMKSGLFKEDLMVIAPEGTRVADPDNVQVEGELRKVVVSQIEKDYSITFDNAAKVEWEGRTAVYADRITPLPDDWEERHDEQTEQMEEQRVVTPANPEEQGTPQQ